MCIRDIDLPDIFICGAHSNELPGLDKYHLQSVLLLDKIKGCGIATNNCDALSICSVGQLCEYNENGIKKTRFFNLRKR